MQKSLEKKVLHLRAQHPGNIHTREHLFRSQKEHQTMYTFGTSLKKKKKGSVSRTPPLDFPGGAVDRNLPANAGVTGFIPGLILWPQATKVGGPQLLSPCA